LARRNQSFSDYGDVSGKRSKRALLKNQYEEQVKRNGRNYEAPQVSQGGISSFGGKEKEGRNQCDWGGGGENKTTVL